MVPTFGRPRALGRCLAALAELELPGRRFEVVVVDDGGTPPAAATAYGFEDRLEVRVVRQRNAGPAAARNRGAQEARAPLLAFTDDDCAPRPDWLRLLVAALEDHPGALVGGFTVNALTGNLYSAGSQLVVDAIYGHYNAPEVEPGFFTTNNMAVAATSFREAGGFDATFPVAGGEDREFCDRWAERGGRLVHVPEARIDHWHDMTLGGLWRQHYAYGRGTAFFHRARAERGRGRVAAEPSLHLELLASPLRQGRPARRLALLLLVILTQVAYAGGFLREELRLRRSR